MRAWTVDADDIQVVDDFDAKLLHRTPWIDDFLTHGRDQKFIVTATKGFGKTLLLKAKRLAYEESKRPIACRKIACSTNRSATRCSVRT